MLQIFAAFIIIIIIILFNKSRALKERRHPGRVHLRSADSGQYDVPRVSTLAGPRAFPVAGPLAWNQLPASLRNMNCIAAVKHHLKTILFKAAYVVADN